ncbi:peptidase [Prevotella sp. oral taxon 376]|uniref:DNA alkylation repair protein n=1 Tax=Prevotella sp. oral taxon 376 TaxID=712466 RepID=UPI000D1DD042|nr:DNA alkylation repair protein [Prevotella sp. oral taxon 376]PTL32682.1 peptidase [Prevotella sp. oral taxon 376]
MISEETKEKIKKIKQSFRLIMNGPISQSMREKGINYKINWGVPLIELQKMAEEYPKDYELAIELYKEDIRECKILATLLMPQERMLPEITEIWMEQCPSQEIAEMLAFNLFQHLDYASVLAYQWMASDDPFSQITAYQILSKLFTKGQEPNERGINEYLDQVAVALQSSNVSVRHAAYNSLMRFIDLGTEYKVIARNAMKSQGFDII